MKNHTILYSMIAVLWACTNVSAQTVAPIPRIVASVQLTGQAGPILTTTLFTPKHNGLFRFSGTMVVTTAGNQNGAWNVNIGFSPDTGATTWPTWLNFSSNRLGGGAYNNTLTVRNNAGQPLTYSVTCDGDCSGSVYELFLTVEQIQ